MDECVDNPDYIDVEGHNCYHWVGYNCYYAYENWSDYGWTEELELELLENCCATCYGSRNQMIFSITLVLYFSYGINVLCLKKKRQKVRINFASFPLFSILGWKFRFVIIVKVSKTMYDILYHFNLYVLFSEIIYHKLVIYRTLIQASLIFRMVAILEPFLQSTAS